MRRYCLVLFILLVMFPISVRALEIDVSKKGNLHLVYQYGDKYISGSVIKIYQVAEVNSGGKYTFLDSYDINDTLVHDSASEWNELAVLIKKYVDDNNINPSVSCTSNDNGVCDFSDVSVGLYLVISEMVEIGNTQYSSSPSLIAVPTLNQVDNKSVYDVSAFLKTEAKSIKVEEVKEDTKVVNTTVPKTVDTIYMYVLIFVVSVVLLGCVVLYINRLRKKESKNEKND